MSNIAALVYFDGSQPGLPDIVAMTDAARHRGPDGIHHHAAGMAALGHCMLHTTAESLEEEQPLTNGSGDLVLVMDGRVDNAPELRHALRQHGCRLRNGSDAELVLHAYETWGEDCLARIDGDFALLVWDARRQRVFGARDRIGIKPFHYRWANRRLAVASEMAGVVQAPGVAREFNLGAIAEYLADSPLSTDETFISGCLRLPPGHFLIADAAGVRLCRYWNPEDAGVLFLPRYEDYVERLAELVANATVRRLRSHLPVGTLLSGGIDSSTVACFASEALSTHPQGALHTYSLVYPGMSCDEQAPILLFLDRLGIPPEQRHFFDGTTPNVSGLEASLARPDLPDSPIGAAFYPLYADAAGRGCRVMLGGWGADDWIGGGPGRLTDQFMHSGWANRIRWLLAQCRTHGTRRGIERLAQYAIRPRVGRMLQKCRWLSAMRSASTYAPPWLSPELAGLLEQRRAAKLGERMESGSYRKAQTLGWMRSGMFANNTILQDAGCAMHGLEGRYPFHDRSIVEFSVSLPPQVLAGETRYKQLLHGALDTRFPVMRGHVFADPEGSPIYASATFDARFAELPLARLASAGWIEPGAACAFRRHMASLRQNGDVDQLAIKVRILFHLIALERWVQLNAMSTGGLK